MRNQYQLKKFPGIISKSTKMKFHFWDYVSTGTLQCVSMKLPNNTPKPVTLLGDNLVLFRDAEGKACTLENRCPHRNPLLSIGQVGVWEAGTITCRYHGATFNGKGECVAFLADGPDSPSCKNTKTRSYPTEEHGGVIFVYMGEREPKPFLEAHPHAKQVFKQKYYILHPMDAKFSYLNQLDNTLDVSHVSCLHRTLGFFAGQKSHTGVGYETVEADGVQGLHAYSDGGPEHPGAMAVDEIYWFPPNFVYHAPGEVPGGFNSGYFWFVPTDIGRFKAWMIMGTKEYSFPFMSKFVNVFMNKVFSTKGLPGLRWILRW